LSPASRVPVLALFLQDDSRRWKQRIPLIDAQTSTGSLVTDLMTPLYRDTLYGSHHLFEYRLILEIEHLTWHVLQFLPGQVHAFVHQQDQIAPLRSTYLGHLAA